VRIKLSHSQQQATTEFSYDQGGSP